MKNYLVTFAVIVLSSLTIFGQNDAVFPVAAKTVKAGSTPEEREKFDPARDPKIDFDQAVANAVVSGKRIILDVGGEWCGWCRYMDKFFSQNPVVAKLRDDNFIWVKVNFSEENENKIFLSAFPAIKGYPHLFVLDENGKLIQSQNTEELESKDGYDLQKFSDFLLKWAPPKISDEQ